MNQAVVPPSIYGHGGDRVAAALAAHGVGFLFTLCGGHIAPIRVAAKARGVRVVDVRDEATAVFAAIVLTLEALRRWLERKLVALAGRVASRVAAGHEKLVPLSWLSRIVSRLVLLGVRLAAVFVAYLWLMFVLRRFVYTHSLGEQLHLLPNDGVVVSKKQGGNGSISVQGDATVGGKFCIGSTCITESDLVSMLNVDALENALSSQARTLAAQEKVLHNQVVAAQSAQATYHAQFVAKVAEGRKMQAADVEKIAQGRVWSGAEAAKLGLVDEIGGLDAAVRYAAKRAGLQANCRLVEYPSKRDLSEVIADIIGRKLPEATRAGATGVLAQAEERLREELAAARTFNDPRGVYARMPVTLVVR